MTLRPTFAATLLAGVAIPLAVALPTTLAAQDAPIVLPGAPGQPSRTVTADEAIAITGVNYAPGDVRFMQNMMVHHRQAVAMAELAKTRGSDEAVGKIADRILATQADEIAFMQEWLAARGESETATPAPAMQPAGAGHEGHDMPGQSMAGHEGMMGMATPEQMAQLAALTGADFDRMFLNLMIAHHKGAIDMVRQLHSTSGTAYEPTVFEFTNEVVSDQNAEIDRMNALLARLSADPRANLSAGFRDAGEAILNMRLIAAMPKPAGFYDPENPAQLQPLIADKSDAAADAAADAGADGDDREEILESEEKKPRFGERGSLLTFWSTDMAFKDDLLITGSYHGFNIYRLGAAGVPAIVSSTVCPGGQGDVSVVGDLLLMSVQDSRARLDCGLGGVQGRVSDERMRGLRIFDISDIARPRQAGAVQTCRGSHTHSVVSADDRRVVVYNSGTSYVRPDEEMSGCFEDGGDGTALFSIDVIEIPVADPGKARLTGSPRVFAQGGNIAGLWRGGDHGDGTQDTRVTDQCHDITVFPSKKIAAGACSGNGIVMDISDPLKPTRISDVTDEGFAYWHSATFNNDGTKVLFTDEWGGGTRPRCQAGDPKNWGANAFYAVEGGKLIRRGTFKLPAPQGDKENCVAHNGSIIPVPGRDIFVQAWYQGGISVIDFTDAANPFEIAYFDRGPVDADQLVTAGYWSAYWYKGRIYATEIARGLDVFALEPSKFLTAEEIAAASNASYPGNVFNPQTQTQVTWSEESIRAVEASRLGG